MRCDQFGRPDCDATCLGTDWHHGARPRGRFIFPHHLRCRGADQTSALGINGARQVVSYLIDNKTHGFLRSATGALTVIDVPGADQTSALGINAPGRS